MILVSISTGWWSSKMSCLWRKQSKLWISMTWVEGRLTLRRWRIYNHQLHTHYSINTYYIYTFFGLFLVKYYFIEGPRWGTRTSSAAANGWRPAGRTGARYGIRWYEYPAFHCKQPKPPTRGHPRSAGQPTGQHGVCGKCKDMVVL